MLRFGDILDSFQFGGRSGSLGSGRTENIRFPLTSQHSGKLCKSALSSAIFRWGFPLTALQRQPCKRRVSISDSGEARSERRRVPRCGRSSIHCRRSGDRRSSAASSSSCEIPRTDDMRAPRSALGRRRDVPSGRDEFPFQSITVECPLCGDPRRYLPSEVFLGRPDQLVVHQRRVGGR